jgi:hypothetical protein
MKVKLDYAEMRLNERAALLEVSLEHGRVVVSANA